MNNLTTDETTSHVVVLGADVCFNEERKKKKASVSMTWCNAELKHVERTENCWMCICSLSWWSYWVWNLCDFSFLKHESRPAPNTRPRFSSSVVEVFLFLFFFLLWKPNSEHVAIFSVLCQLFSTPPRLTPPPSVSLCVCVSFTCSL